MDPGAAGTALLLTLLLVAANAFFVMAEYAMVRVRPTQLAELAAGGSRRARGAAEINRRLDAYISTVQVGVTGASLALGIVGEPAIAALLRPALLPLAGASEALFHAASFVVAYGLVTYVTLVVSELLPKYVALRYALPLALWTAYPLHLAYRVLFPFVWLVNTSAGALARLVRVTPTSELDAMSAEELKVLVAASTRRGLLTESERTLLANAIDFADRLARQVMVPRTEVIALRSDRTVAEAREVAAAYPHSRFPVYAEDIDHVVGIVERRDLAASGDGAASLATLARPTLFVPETTHLDQLLTLLRRGHTLMAIVVDEFGGTAGIVTLEDVLVALAGDVGPEAERRVQARPDGSLLVDGLATVEELRDAVPLDAAEGRYDTVGGLVFGRLGRLARTGDTVEIDGHRFTVTVMDGKRVAQVLVKRAPPTAA